MALASCPACDVVRPASFSGYSHQLAHGMEAHALWQGARHADFQCPQTSSSSSSRRRRLSVVWRRGRCRRRCLGVLGIVFDVVVPAVLVLVLSAVVVLRVQALVRMWG